MGKSRSFRRREFLKSLAAGAAAPMVVSSSVLGLDGHVAPSDRIGLGVIGLGFAWEMGLEKKEVQYRAVCDVQAARRDNAKRMIDQRQGNQDCKTYNDFRELLARDDIDAVYIATPDHWHALVTVAAARAGKDIYCQKPLTHTVAEGRAVVEAVRRHGVVFQHGTQQRSEWSFWFGAELVLNGRIGRLKTVRLGVPGGRSCPPQPVQPVPPGFDWNLWLGPAPFAPFTTFRCFGPHAWYFISDYCVGYVSAWGIHHLDSALQGSGNDQPGPVEVEGRGVFPKDGLYDTALRWRINYTFPNGVRIVETDTTQTRMGVLYEGTEGRVFCWRGNRLETEPKSLRDEIIGPDEIHVDESTDHFQNWLDCLRTRAVTVAPVEVAHHSTTLCNIGVISLLVDRKLRWNDRTERFDNDDEANRMLSYAMRDPWRL